MKKIHQTQLWNILQVTLYSEKITRKTKNFTPNNKTVTSNLIFFSPNQKNFIQNVKIFKPKLEIFYTKLMALFSFRTFPYKTFLSEANIKKNRIERTKWTYHEERSFSSNRFIFLKILFQFKNLLGGVDLMYQLSKCPCSYFL